MGIRRHWWAVLYSLLLTAFTLYLLLDTFVISRVYAVSPPESSPEKTDSSAADAEVSPNTYSDGNITIAITEYRIHDTTVYAADITLSSPEYLKTAFAQNAYGRNVTAKTSETAAAEWPGPALPTCCWPCSARCSAPSMSTSAMRFFPLSCSTPSASPWPAARSLFPFWPCIPAGCPAGYPGIYTTPASLP